MLCDVAFRSRDVAFRSRDVAFRSRDVAFRSHDVAFRPRDVAFRPRDVAFRSRDVAFRSHDVALPAKYIFLKGILASVAPPPFAGVPLGLCIHKLVRPPLTKFPPTPPVYPLVSGMWVLPSGATDCSINDA